MSFETMDEALNTLCSYSRRLCDIYRAEQQTAADVEVKAALQLAEKYECKLADQLQAEIGEVAGKLRAAKFKWHDKKLLLETPEHLERIELNRLDDVIQFVNERSQAAIGYCRSLTASTNSADVLEFVDGLGERREQYLKDFVRQAGRGMQ